MSMLSQLFSVCNDYQIIDLSPSSTSLERTDHFPELFSNVDKYNQTIDVIHPPADFSFPSKEFGNRTYRCQADLLNGPFYIMK